MIISLISTKIYRWLCSNKLSLNVGKTKFACFHTAQRIVAYPELKINNVIIDRVTEFNFLGLIISSNMKWKKHIDHIALKVSKIIGIMYRLKFILPADVLLTRYNSLILPHFNYCHLAWGSNHSVYIPGMATSPGDANHGGVWSSSSGVGVINLELQRQGE